jgi:hypothetical protein
MEALIFKKLCRRRQEDVTALTRDVQYLNRDRPVCHSRIFPGFKGKQAPSMLPWDQQGPTSAGPQLKSQRQTH